MLYKLAGQDVGFGPRLATVSAISDASCCLLSLLPARETLGEAQRLRGLMPGPH